LLVIRFVSLLFAVGTILTTYFLGKALYDRDTGFAAALFLLALPYFLRMGTAARTDMPMLFFFALGILLTLRLLQTPTYRLAIGAGLVVGLGLLSRYTMVLICPVLLAYSLIHGSFRRCEIHLGIVALVVLTMLALWLVYAGGIGVLPAQLDTVVRHAGIARSTSDGSRWMFKVLSKWEIKELLTAWPSNLGAYNIPILLLGGWHLTRRRNQSDWRILLWITVVSSLVILTTAVPRYALPISPALAIVMAQALQSVPEGTERAGMLALLYGAGAMYMYAG
jgi:4-amino-4-deoxy-L-arabinose transferase-like glycosyltransferase